MQEDREEERGDTPVPEEARDEGSGSGDEAITGPTKDADSVPGGGTPDGPSPGGVPQEGGVEDDPDISTGST